MKTNKILRVCPIFLLVTLLGLSLVSCQSVSRDEAIGVVEGFLEALKVDDNEKAESFFHTGLLESMEEQGKTLESVVREIEEAVEVDFSEGSSIKKQKSFHTTSGTNGGLYEMTLILTVGEKDIECDMAVLKTEDGFGLSTFRVRPGDN